MLKEKNNTKSNVSELDAWLGLGLSEGTNRDRIAHLKNSRDSGSNEK